MIQITTELEVVVCDSQGCGIQFGVPADFLARRRKDHAAFYCPNGHQRYYPAETEEERLRKELASAQGNLKYARERLEREKARGATLERSRAALRGVATRLRTKAKVGECAFCGRHFNDVALHMAEAHADVDPEQIEEEAEEGATS